MLKIKTKKNELSEDDAMLIEILTQIRKSLDSANTNLNYATEPLLIDSYIYELKSLHVKHEYYIKQCKERGLAAGLF